MIIYSTIMGLALVLQAGTEKPAAKKPAVEQEGKKDTRSILQLDPLRYTYNPFGKRDPFRSFLLDGLPSDERDINPLLQYSLTQLRLTGIIWGITNPKAIITDGRGQGHIISRGTRIGRSKGRVLRILKDKVIVAEEFRDPLGKLVVSEYVMEMFKGTKK
jgi:type IV pilus assembly protein PilP